MAKEIYLNGLTADQLSEMIRESLRDELQQLRPLHHKSDTKYLTRQETARRLRISLVTLTDWVNRGKICALKVEVDYEIYLPIEDNHFTNRLKYPAKSFRIDCICNDDDNVRLYGELLGTFTENSKIKISHPNDNVISIEAFDWLLPRNGVFVILCEKTSSIDRM